MSSLETKVSFELPKGYVDNNGKVHRLGIMRLATAADEIIPMNDTRVKLNPAYLSILILERVIVKLGELPHIDAKIIESLYTSDMAYLQDLYQRINSIDTPEVEITCPKCANRFKVPVPFFDQA